MVREPLFLLTTTVLFYVAGAKLQDWTRSALANPTMIAIVLVGGMLRVLRIPYATYFAGVQALHFLLGPATVALAVPMVLSAEHLRRGWLALAMALSAGCLVGAVSGYELMRWMGAGREMALTMLTKSVTTPIAMGVSETIGGIPALAAVFGVLTGVLVAVVLRPLLRVLRVRKPAAVGLAAGTAGSGIGASSVIPLGPVEAAFAGVGIGMNGLLTALVAPVLARLLR